MFTLGVILARAGSKGLPDKCIRPVLGRPMIEYTLDHALESKLLDGVMLTSDSAQARQLAAQRGITAIERPPELATDSAAVDAAARHAVAWWEAHHGEREVFAVVLLYANIPVRPPGVIDRALRLMFDTCSDSVRTVTPVGKHHPDWMYRLDGSLMRQYRPNTLHRRQELEPLYALDGAVQAVTRRALFLAREKPADPQAFLGVDQRALVLKPGDSVDVDTPLDLYLAEAVLRAQRVAWEPAL